MSGPTTALDVWPVEPRNRFETIMNAFDEVPLGGTLDLTVDHDPLCMYYTLKVMRGTDAFSFQYLEEGPEVWRVAVGRLV